MDPVRLQQIADLYHSVRESAADRRTALLAQADPELRREVVSLLARQDESLPVLDPLTATLMESGTRLGPYQVESKLGAGGMGEVFRAVDTRLGRAVAIKVVDQQFIARFGREARAISSLNHPHICTLYDIGPDFLVMELLEGETLASRLKKGPLPIDLVLQYAAQIASALAVAHSKGIVHRDLKPGNIMLTRSGVKVLDFGLAKTIGDETLTLGVLGTPAYMSPEQREGRRCDHRTDIYAFGLILREMATGRRGTTPSAAEAPQFKQLVDRCLRGDPDDRWQSAGDLANIIEWSRAQSDTSRVTSARSKPNADTWKTPLIAGAALILLLAVVVWKGIMPRMAAPSVVRLALALPSEGLVSDPGQLSGPPVISPDG